MFVCVVVVLCLFVFFLYSTKYFSVVKTVVVHVLFLTLLRIFRPADGAQWAAAWTPAAVVRLLLRLQHLGLSVL